MRLVGIDIARFVAFAGMVFVNFRIVAGTPAGTDWASSFTQMLEGRAAALFVILAGLGIALARPSAGLLIRRGIALFFIGLLNLAIFPADILHFYGVYFLIAIFFLQASLRRLLLGALAITLLSYLALFLLDYDAGWNWDTLDYVGLWTVDGFIRNLFFNGWHPVFPWVAFVLIGMAIGRFDLLQLRVQLWLLIGGAGIATLTNGVSNWIATTLPDIALVTGTTPIPPNPFYVLSASTSACAMLGACLLLTPILKRLHIANALALTGRQALTLYIAHIVIGMGILEGFGWINGALTPSQIFDYSLGFIGLTVIYATLWKRIAPRGPLEHILRKITERTT